MPSLTKNEKSLLQLLTNSDIECLNNDKNLQYAYLLQEKGLVTIEKSEDIILSLTPEGESYVEYGLPEEQLLALLDHSVTIDEAKLQLGSLYNVAISNALKQKLVYINGKTIYKVL